MRYWKVVHVKYSFYGDFKVWIKDRQFGTTCQELYKLVQLFLVITFQNLPKPFYYH